MGWTKVTPETMPPDMKVVIVKVLHDSGIPSVNALAWYSKTRERWERVSDPGQWRSVGDAWDLTTLFECVDGTVTHWMPWSSPAED